MISLSNFGHRISLNNFPDCLKQANVSPIFKKDDPLDKENYRPVSILPLLSKVYEKLLYNRLSDYVENLIVLGMI